MRILKNYFLYFLLSSLFPFGKAEGQYSQWEKAIGGTNFDEGICMIQTTDGGYAIIGTTESFGQGGYDVYVVKVDSTGTLQWTKTIGGTGTDIGYSIVQTKDKGFGIAGYTSSFGQGYVNAYVIKLDSSGNLIWTRTVGLEYATTYAYTIVNSNDGGFIVGGTMININHSQGAYCFKVDSLGNVIWTKVFNVQEVNPDMNSVFYSAINTSDRGYAFAGYANGWGAGYANDCYIVKTDSNGNVQWASNVGGTVENIAYSVKQSNDGGYVVAGYTSSYGAGGNDVYVVKLDVSGNLKWTRTIGGTGTDAAWSVVITDDGGYLVAGYTNSFGAGGYDAYLIKLDSVGAVQWTKTMGGTGNDYAYSLIKTIDRGYAIVGSTTSYGNGNADVFLLKLDLLGNPCSVSGSGGIIDSGGTLSSGYNIISVGSIDSGGIAGSGGTEVPICSADTCSIPLSVVHTNLKCCGDNNGMAIVTVLGGLPPFTYSWSPYGGSGDTAQGLVAGDYVVTVHDNLGCIGYGLVSITQPPCLQDTISSTCAHCCNCQGTTHVYVWGGTQPYTYLWSNGRTNDTMMHLSSDTFSVKIWDANGCCISDTIFVHHGSDAGISITPPLCYGETGCATLSVLGTYSFNWSPNGGSGSSACGLSAGSYTVTVTESDTSTCFDSYVINISQPPPLYASATLISGVKCYGDNNGSASATVSGGTPPYAYHWSDGESTPIASSLPGGGASVTVTDANGCTVNASLTIPEPTQLTISVPSYVHVCPTGCTWETATASGGTPPYNFLWGTTAGATVCISSSYNNPINVMVTDANGCMANVNEYIYVFSCSATVISNVSCYGGHNGSATTTIYNGSGYYTYTWTPSGGNNATATGLSAGSYTVTAYDTYYNCQWSAFITITQPNLLVVSAITTNNNNCHSGNLGSASSTVSGGTTPYTYLWSGGHGSNTTATGLSAGTYTLNVTDHNGCTGSATATITQPTSLKDSIQMVAICVGDSATLNDISSGGTLPYSYLWSTGGTNNSINVAPPITTEYFLTVTDSNGCVSKDSSTVKVNSLPTNVTLIAQSGDTICNDAGTILLFGTPLGGIFSGNAVSGSFFYPDSANTGVYNLFYYSYTDSNGCTAIASDSLLVEVCTSINQLGNKTGNITIFPNPNNGTFTISLSNINENCNVEIYDVVGQKIFTQSLLPQTPKGALNEINLADKSAGVYFYRVVTESGALVGEGKMVIAH